MNRDFNSETPSNHLNNVMTDFVDYVDSFYGENDPVYPMVKTDTMETLSRVDIYGAVYEYLQLCTDETETLYTWGDGDSLDRERVRDILLKNYNYKLIRG